MGKPKKKAPFHRDSYTHTRDYVADSDARVKKHRCEDCGLIPGKHYPAQHPEQTDATECSCHASWFEVPSERWDDLGEKSESKHTPGPWIVTKRPNDIIVIGPTGRSARGERL